MEIVTYLGDMALDLEAGGVIVYIRDMVLVPTAGNSLEEWYPPEHYY